LGEGGFLTGKALQTADGELFFFVTDLDLDLVVILDNNVRFVVVAFVLLVFTVFVSFVGRLVVAFVAFVSGVVLGALVF
jgi:hypothetical protein